MEQQQKEIENKDIKQQNNEPEYELKPINFNLLSEEDLHPTEAK